MRRHCHVHPAVGKEVVEKLPAGMHCRDCMVPTSPVHEQVKIALCQILSGENKESNIQTAVAAIKVWLSCVIKQKLSHATAWKHAVWVL
eukprot:363984-Chlamydomonas_euryale.AAC.25